MNIHRYFKQAALFLRTKKPYVCELIGVGFIEAESTVGSGSCLDFEETNFSKLTRTKS
jgi:hypothetical protein